MKHMSNWFWNTFCPDGFIRLKFDGTRFRPSDPMQGEALFKLNCPRSFGLAEYDNVLLKVSEAGLGLETIDDAAGAS